MTDTFTAADLDAIQKQIAELAEQIDWQISIRDELLNKCQEQQAHIDALETALGFYADLSTWLPIPMTRGCGLGATWASADRGERARKALKGVE